MFFKIYLFFFIRINRNYKELIKKNKLDIIRKLKSDLSNYEIREIKNKFSAEYEISVRQYLFQNLLGQFFLKQLFFFLNSKKIIFPIPKDWNIVFEKNSFKVSKFSNYLFKLYLLTRIFNGIIFIFKTLYEFFIIKKKVNNHSSNDVIVHNLNPIHLKDVSGEINNQNIFFWLKNKYPNNNFFFVNKVIEKSRNSKFSYINYFYSNLIKDLNLIKFLFGSINIIFQSIFNLLKGDWGKTLMTEELVKKILISSINLNKDSLPKKNIFFYTGNIYRPLWTYEMEKFTDIDLLLTSELSDVELSATRNSESNNYRGYNLITWSNIYVWSKKNFMEFEKILPKSKIQISSPISMTDSSFQIIFSKRIISIFAYDLVRGYYGISTQIDYLSDKQNTSLKFFKDIIYLSEKYNFNILIKNKSKNSKYIYKKFVSFMNSLSLKKNIQIVDPLVSPHKMIKISEAVISLPLTSTYEIGNYYNKPSIYYDPINLLEKKNFLLNSFDELEDWFKNLDIQINS